MAKRESNKAAVVSFLFEKLKEEKALWSYDLSDVHAEDVPDKEIIALTMRHLDLTEIDMLFRVYPLKKIKDSWKEILVPESDYLYTLNRFFAWFYFGAKKPDAYLKSLITRQINRVVQ